MTDITEIVAEQIRNSGSSWSMGSYGAVAEFFQEPGEAIHSGSDELLTRRTPRGGIQIELRDDMGFCAYENPGSHGSAQQHIAFCLPAGPSRMSGNNVLTELGPDDRALDEMRRGATLFDLGVSSLGSGCFQLDFCVRTDDPALLGFLRTHSGTDVFDHGSPVFGRLLEAQPHRVILTRLGRIEVYQPIGGEHTDDKTPEGPHTHLLPELLSLNLTHPANVPIEEGWVPCAFLYPAEPVAGLSGSELPLRADQ
jgi:hypothetical protein